MKKIIIPEGMLRAACRVGTTIADDAEPILEAALRWLSKNPIVPDDKLANELWSRAHDAKRICEYPHAGKQFAIDLQRRMFLAPEPEMPEIADLVKDFRRDGDAYNAILEAFRRGQKSKE